MLASIVLGAFLGATSAVAAAPSCGVGNKCPKATPCCSQYGQCGIGAFCLGGCDPLTSFSLDSCLPAPVCQDQKHDFKSLDRVQDISEYLGDESEADWVVSGEALPNKGNVLLTMPKGSVGTVMSSTVYMWYGTVKARMKTSRGNGVVTAFILFSSVKDEIDFEWIGADLETTQTNFYFQGITNYENSENITMSNSFAEFHDYELRWTPDKIEWYINGKLGRTMDRKDTWNATSQNWGFPQTPSRVQLSLWPGGLATNPKGTIDWAGGEIDWDHEDIQKTGYYWAEVESVSIECYNGDGIGSNAKKSYYYNDQRGTNDTVVDSDRDTTIASLQATGLDPDKGKKDEDEDEDNNDDDEDNNDDEDEDDDDDDTPVLTVPGGNNGSPGNDDHSDDSSSDNGGGGNGGDGGNNDGPSNGGGSSDCAEGEFCQNLNDGNDGQDGGNGGGGSVGTKSSASALAIIVAGFALYWL